MNETKNENVTKLHAKGAVRYQNEWANLPWEDRVVIKWIGWLAIVVGIVGWFLLNVILALVLNSQLEELLTYNVGYWLMVSATWWLRPNSRPRQQDRKDD